MKKFLFVLLVFCMRTAVSQSPITMAFNTTNGFGSEVAYATYFDSRGFLWIASEGAGAVMYNGKTFKHFTIDDGLCANSISSICEDKNGNMWFGSFGNGVSIFDGKSFISYTAADSIGLTDNTVMSLFKSSNDDIYLGTFNEGLFIYKNGGFEKLTPSYKQPTRVWQILEDKNGIIWFSTTDQGLGKYAGKTVQYFGEDAGIPTEMTLGLKFDLNGDLLLGTDIGLYRVRDEKMIQKYDVSNGFYEDVSKNTIRSLYVRKNGDILLGMFSNFWTMKNDQLVRQRKHGHLKSSPTSISENTNQELWMSTEQNGLIHMPYNGIYCMAIPNSDESITAVYEHKDGSIYVATLSHIYRSVDGVLVTLGEKFLMYDNFDLIALDSNRVQVFSNSHGIAQYTSKEKKMTSGQVSRLQFHHITRLSDSLVAGTIPGGNIWTYNIYDYSLDTLFSAENNPDLTGILFSIDKAPDGMIWAGTYDTRLIIGVSKSDTLIFTEKNGVPPGSIVDFAFDKNETPWFLNSDGYFGYQKGDSIISFNPLVKAGADGLTFDTNGNLWIANAKGVLFLEIKDYKILFSRQFNQYDGLPEIRGSYGMIKTLQDGRILLSKADNRVYIIDPNEIKPDTEKPRLYFETISGKDLKMLDSSWYASSTPFFHIPDSLCLPYNENNLTINLGVIYFSQPDSIRYTYMLEGYDNSWSPLQTTSTIVFTNLPAGDYTLRCKAVGANHNESEEISFAFSVATPWYQTWLFYLLTLTVVMLIIYLFVKWRLSKLQKDKEKLEVIVEERTREVVFEKEKVEEKNREILDSISYAKRIQAAILPPARLVKEYLPDNFILYQPKDIVAGDFYWMHSTGDEILFAAADCTGHGVPGAMVSVVCNGGLNRSVREYGLTDPGKILDKTREIVISEFEKSEDEVKDGMDISLCALNTKTRKLNWAGANNPLWIIQTRNGETTLTEIKPDKQPIGKYAAQKDFTSHKIQLEKNDLIYIFTDGYQDQFGGDKGKKFKVASMKEVLLNIHPLSMDEQRTRLLSALESWKGNLEQVDDICMIGVRII